jgi:hypothetical protein
MHQIYGILSKTSGSERMSNYRIRKNSVLISNKIDTWALLLRNFTTYMYIGKRATAIPSIQVIRGIRNPNYLNSNPNPNGSFLHEVFGKQFIQGQ